MTYKPSFAALGDPTRRAIFEYLSAHPSAVGELAEVVPVSRPAVSQHLKVLKVAGLVIDRPMGTRRIYEVDPKGVGEMRDYLDRFWSTALSGFKARIDQRQKVQAQGEELSDE